MNESLGPTVGPEEEAVVLEAAVEAVTMEEESGEIPLGREWPLPVFDEIDEGLVSKYGRGVVLDARGGYERAREDLVRVRRIGTRYQPVKRWRVLTCEHRALWIEAWLSSL